MELAAGARVAVVLPYADARHSAIWIAASRQHPNLALFVPAAPAEMSWPQGVAPRELPSVLRTRYTAQWLRCLERSLAEYRPDLVHAHYEPWAVTCQRLVRYRWPVVVHGGENRSLDAPWPYRVRRTGCRAVLRRSAGYVNWGSTGLRAFAAAGLPPDTPRAVISGGPPDPAVFAYVPPPSVRDGQLVLVFVGRLVPEKGVADLLAAVSRARGAGGIRVRVVGDGPQREPLERLAAQLRVSAEFTGALDPGALHREIAAAHALVVPSRDTSLWTEQWGRVVVEAFMTGRPVIASDSGELPMLVGDGGCTFPQGDVPELARVISEIVAEPARLEDWAARARDRAQLFTPDVLAGQLLDFWAEVLEHSAQKRGEA